MDLNFLKYFNILCYYCYYYLIVKYEIIKKIK